MARTSLLPLNDPARWRPRYLVPLLPLVVLVLLASAPAGASARAGDPGCADPAGDQYCPPYEDPCVTDPADPAGDQYCTPYTGHCETDPAGGDPAADQYCSPYADGCAADPGGSGDPAADQYCPPYAQTCVREGSGADGYCPPGYAQAAGPGNGSQGGQLPFAGADLALGFAAAGALLLAGGLLRRHLTRFRFDGRGVHA